MTPARTPEELAIQLTPMFLELTGDYSDVPPDEVWSRPRYEWLKLWFCRLTNSAIIPALDATITDLRARIAELEADLDSRGQRG